MPALKLVEIPQYPRFARQFKLMLTRLALDNPYAYLSSDNDGSVGKYFYNNNDCYIYKNGYYKWIKGLVDDKEHTLRGDNFKNFLIENLGKPGLDHYSDISRLLHAGPLEYRCILDNGEFIRTLENKGIQIADDEELDPAPFYEPIIPSKIIDREALRIFGSKKKPSWRVLLTGAPGSGKSTILGVLTYTTFLTAYDQTIWLDASTEESLKATLTKAQGLFLPDHELEVGAASQYQLKQLMQVLQKQHIILLVENCHQKEVYEMITSHLTDKCDWIFEIKRPEVAHEIDPGGDSTITVPQLTDEEREAYWAYIAHPVKNMTRQVFDRLCFQTKNNPGELFLALGAVATYGVEWALQEYASAPHADMLERTIGFLSQDQLKRFARLGALPQLLSYDLDVFSSLWECDEHAAYSELIRFAGLNWAQQIPDGNGWMISKSVLKYAGALLQRAEDGEQKQANLWLTRINIKALNTEFGKKHPIKTIRYFQMKKRGPKFYPNVLIRVAKQFINPAKHNTYWNLFKGLEPWMRSEEWLAAYYYYRKDIQTFNFARLIILVTLIIILLFGNQPIIPETILIYLFFFPVVVFLIYLIINFIPAFRSNEATTLQIWHAIQERKGA